MGRFAERRQQRLKNKQDLQSSPDKENKQGKKKYLSGAMHMLHGMDQKKGLAEQQDNIIKLRQQITSDEISLLNHQVELRGFAEEYFEWKKKVKDGDVKEDDEEAYEYFESTRCNYEDCQDKIHELAERVGGMEKELVQCEELLKASRKKAQQALAEKKTKSGNEDNDDDDDW